MRDVQATQNDLSMFEIFWKENGISYFTVISRFCANFRKGGKSVMV